MSVSLSYFPNVPFRTDAPKDDQPSMLINSQSIGSWVAVDHVPFNSLGPINQIPGGGGQHLQITFNGNNVQNPSPTLSYLFTDKVTASPTPGNNFNQLFYYPAGANLNQSQDQYISNGNGSTYLFGGNIIKWGLVAFSPNTNTTQVFTYASLGLQPFPNNTLNVQVTPNSGAAGLLPGTIAATTTYTAAGFTLNRNGSGGGLPTQYWFLAIGF